MHGGGAEVDRINARTRRAQNKTLPDFLMQALL